MTDGIDLGAKKVLQELGHSVSEKHFSNDDLIDGCISEYDVVIIRSATKLTADVIKANTANDSKLSMIIRAVLVLITSIYPRPQKTRSLCVILQAHLLMQLLNLR